MFQAPEYDQFRMWWRKFCEYFANSNPKAIDNEKKLYRIYFSFCVEDNFTSAPWDLCRFKTKIHTIALSNERNDVAGHSLVTFVRTPLIIILVGDGSKWIYLSSIEVLCYFNVTSVFHRFILNRLHIVWKSRSSLQKWLRKIFTFDNVHEATV